jgi:tetratricopeptide (TPR) repeat protein
MNPQTTNWLPGLLVLAFGSLAAAVYLFVSKLKSSPPAAAGDELDAQYARVLTLLKEHLATRHLQAGDVFESEKLRLEWEAADILRAKASTAHAMTKEQARLEKKAAAKAADTSFAGRHPMAAGLLLGGAAVGFVVLVGMQLNRFATTEPEAPPQMAGPPPSVVAADEAALSSLAARLQANPTDLDLIAELTNFLMMRESFEEAQKLAARMAELDPYFVKGRVERAALSAISGDPQSAVDELERLAATFPEAYGAHLYVTMIAMESAPDRARSHLELFVRKAPPREISPMVRALMAELRSRTQNK